MSFQNLRALVVSPSATHPRDYGNRNRVWQTARFLKGIGYRITFLLYPIETDWQAAIPSSYTDMKAEWDEVIIIPPSMPLHQLARGDHHDIDEWWDPEIGHYLSWFLKRQFFDVIFVNYSFLSKALEFAPKSTVKVLDTHDLFSGRKEMLAENNVPPEFFYTTPEQERIAFGRADLVLAIKDSEHDKIRALTDKTVLSVPYYPADTAPDAAAGSGGVAVSPVLQRPQDDKELVVGFIGAENSVNIANMRRFLEEMATLLSIYTPPLRIVVAGNVCRGLWSDNPAVRLVGRVKEVADFYRGVDVIVAPLSFSTGIKIKVGEALAFGKPVVSTINGFDGYPVFDPFHRLPDIAKVCRALIKIAYDPQRRALLAERTAMTARMAALATAGGLRSLERAMRRRVRRIVFVTDKPFWRQDTLWNERLYQWHQLLSFLGPIVCVVIGDHPDLPEAGQSAVPGTFLRVRLGAREGLAGAVPAPAPEFRDVMDSMRVVGTVHLAVSVSHKLAPLVESIAAENGQGFIIDRWGDADLADEPPEKDLVLGSTSPDIEIRRASAAPLLLSAAPLRYLPAKLIHWGTSGTGTGVLVIVCSVDQHLRADLDFVVTRLRLADLAVTIVSRNGDPSADVRHADFLSWAATTGRVGTIILIGSDQRMLRLHRAIASYLNVPCEEIAPEWLPRLHRDAEGQVMLVRSVPELVERILLRGSDTQAPYTHDAGWSTVWRVLEAA